MAKKSAIVVGAGIVGMATARALALKGYAVNVYERNLKASGASVRNFGMVWPIGQPAGKQYERAIKSRNCWKEIGDSSRLWYDPVGSLHLANHPMELQVLQELFEAFKEEGRYVTLLNTNEVHSRSGIAKKENCLGGLYSREELIVDPREAIAFLPNIFRLHRIFNLTGEEQSRLFHLEISLQALKRLMLTSYLFAVVLILKHCIRRNLKNFRLPNANFR